MTSLPRILGVALTALALAPLASAQATSSAAAATAAAPAQGPAAAPLTAPVSAFARPSDQWHLYGGFGFGAADGKYGDVLQKPLQWEVRIENQSPSGAWRWGLGLQFGSMDPADDPNIPPETEELWLPTRNGRASRRPSASLASSGRRRRFRPYLQGRVGIERIHPRSELFYEQPPPEDLEPGDSPTKATNGIGLTIQPGFEWSLSRKLSLDAAFFCTYYNTGSYDMSPLGLPDVDSGVEWGGRVGLSWRPFVDLPPAQPRTRWPTNPATGKLLPLPPEDADRDAWGVPAAGAGRPPRCSRSTGAPRCSTSTCATRTSTRSAPAASGTT